MNIANSVFRCGFCSYAVKVVSVRLAVGPIDWVGWRLGRGADGRGWSTRGPCTGDSGANECDSSPVNFNIGLGAYLLGTPKIV